MKQEKKSAKKTEKSSSDSSKTSSKKKIKRNDLKHPAFSKQLSKKTRWHLLDFDYLDQLSPEEKKWLHSFVEEEVHTNFQHKGKKLNKSNEDKRKIYNSNNARNRDTFTLAKAYGFLDPELGIGGDFRDNEGFTTEDTVIELLDAKQSLLEKLANIDSSESKRRNKRKKSK